MDNYKTGDDKNKPKCYVLDMFPYPSGEGLHMGHVKVYTASDIYARYKRMKGFNVLHPTGFDAFGLPAEQYALKNKVHPRISTDKNITTYLSQMKALDFSYDYNGTIDTTDPKFYKWTQWIFKQIYKKGLAYESNEPINWCPSCKTGLANEDLEGNACERCGTIVEKKPLRQWVLKITDYADRLIDDLDTLKAWPQSFIDLEKNWIGRSEGSSFNFEVKNESIKNVEIFTTRADTLFGATYVAISYELAEKWIKSGWVASDEINNFINELKEEDKARAFDHKEIAEKKGIDTGLKAINPANGEEIPVWIANYILAGYGTGAIMAVPAHDERDYEFAKKYNIKIKNVIKPTFSKYTVIEKSLKSAEEELKKFGNLTILEIDDDWGRIWTVEVNEDKEDSFCNFLKESLLPSEDAESFYADSCGTSNRIIFKNKIFNLNITSEEEIKDYARVIRIPSEQLDWGSAVFVLDGKLINSGKFDGLSSEEAKIKITESCGGKLVKQYKLKDWVFARQRYWGEPFPIVFDENHKSYVVADSELPVLLPDVKEYEPTDTGESPLAIIKDWVEIYGYINEEGEFVSCDRNDEKAKLFRRETNTMPQWAGSSWYYLRFIDPRNDEQLVNKDLEKYWQPVDVYVGGAEHATRHLIYARFWHKFLYDIGVVSTVEPFTRLESVGLVLGLGGVKMSKRLGNVINPNDVIKEHGSDVARMYVMFMGPFGQSSAWDPKSISGIKKFLERVKKLSDKVVNEDIDENILHQSIKKIGDNIEEFKFNTAISQLMILLNHYDKEGKVSKKSFIKYLKLLAPFAPKLSNDLWNNIGEKENIHLSNWPTYEESRLVESTVTVAISFNGKLRGTVEVANGATQEEVISKAESESFYHKNLGESTIKKIIFIPNKMLNIVI